ncbi:hypothetical protein GA0061094_4170 [[Bacillus] enclensis]|uniref:Uncharacterized protein n=1 Tax=[Bacillus] enclensis TaxID=1402860 RepID=A0A1C4DTM6_9BACI|nr:hypothetical protein GA0061094_4170 [[Bacillus] enclensis]
MTKEVPDTCWFSQLVSGAFYVGREKTESQGARLILGYVGDRWTGTAAHFGVRTVCRRRSLSYNS